MALRLPDLTGLLPSSVFYRNPFYSAHVTVGRIDQGCDYNGQGTITAIGRCKIIGDGGRGWPGGHYLLYQLLRGRHRGRYVYVAEAIRPCVHAGEIVRKGHPVAYFGVAAAPGKYPGIETGWGSPILNETLAAQTEQPLPPDNSNTRAGQSFARFLHRIGSPAPPVSAGPEYPS